MQVEGHFIIVHYSNTVLLKIFKMLISLKIDHVISLNANIMKFHVVMMRAWSDDEKLLFYVYMSKS